MISPRVFVTDVRVIAFFLCMTRAFIFNTASVIFAVSDPEEKKNKRGNMEVKKKGKAVRP